MEGVPGQRDGVVSVDVSTAAAQSCPSRRRRCRLRAVRRAGTPPRVRAEPGHEVDRHPQCCQHPGDVGLGAADGAPQEGGGLEVVRTLGAEDDEELPQADDRTPLQPPAELRDGLRNDTRGKAMGGGSNG